MFKAPAVRDIIIEAEREWLDDSPFKGVAKLFEISKVCKNPAKMEWVLKTVVNRIKAGSMDAGEFTMRNLAGRSGKQWCEVIMKQRELKSHLLGPFIDSRNIIPAAKERLREVFASPESYVEKFRPLSGDDEALDTSWQASWPRSAHLTLELIEQACFSMSGSEDQLLRVAIRGAKIAEEILAEYSPFKESVKAIDEALAQEHQAIIKQKKEEEQAASSQTAQPANASASASASATGESADAADSAMDDVPVPIDDQKAVHAKRVLASFLVLEVEGNRSQTQLAEDLGKHALVKVKGDEAGGNVMIIFDVNGFGETMTAPHIRRPPIVQEVLKKIYKSLNLARNGEAESAAIPEGEVHVLLDGGRKNNSVFAKIFGAGPGIKRAKSPGPRTVVRQTTVLMSESSVKARKVRLAKGRACLKCTQGMMWWHNSHTSIPTRMHKHFPELSNSSDVYGPIALEAWRDLPTMTVADKKVFWGKRRMACGGKTLSGEDDGENSDEEEEPGEDGKEEEMEFPDVGGGRGGTKALSPTTLQPIVYHEFPITFWQGVLHAVSGSTIIDLTPQAGRLAIWCVTNRIGYVGVCQTDFQKKHILKTVEAKVNTALADPQSPISIPKFVGKREAEQPAHNPRPLTKPPPPPATPPWVAPPPGPVPKPSPTPVPKPAPKPAPGAEGGGLSPALLAMLNAARDA